MHTPAFLQEQAARLFVELEGSRLYSVLMQLLCIQKIDNKTRMGTPKAVVLGLVALCACGRMKVKREKSRGTANSKLAKGRMVLTTPSRCSYCCIEPYTLVVKNIDVPYSERRHEQDKKKGNRFRQWTACLCWTPAFSVYAFCLLTTPIIKMW